MTHGDLFAGIGGFSLAAQSVGWKTIFQVENNKFCTKVLEKNFPEIKRYGDIKYFDGRKYSGRINVLSGGFPCQDISIANVYDGGGKGLEGERSGLWSEYSRLIGEIGPEFIVFENSPMLVQRGLEVLLFDLDRMGYDAEWRNFYATQFGFNHYRKRTYGIAYSRKIGLQNNFEEGGILSKILQKQPPRQDIVSMPSKRFHSKSDFGSVSLHDGFSEELDYDSINGYGNAIIPQIAIEIFKAIKEVNE